MCRYIYYGEIKISFKHAVELLPLVRALEITSLCNILLDKITLTNQMTADCALLALSLSLSGQLVSFFLIHVSVGLCRF